MSKRTGAIWLLIENLLTQKRFGGKPGSGKMNAKPFGGGTFNTMEKVPDSLLEPWLRQLKDGQIDEKVFKANTIRYKIEQ